MKELSVYHSDDGTRKSVVFFNDDSWCYAVYRYWTDKTKDTPKLYEFPTLRQAENMAENWVL